MNPQPKPTRETNKNYLAYIKTLPCLTHGDHDCVGDVVPHHTRTRGAGGSDYLTLPLCHTLHAEIDRGRERFQQVHNIDFKDEIIKCLIGYIKRLEGK